MKNIRKYAAVILCIAMLLSLAACGGDKAAADTSEAAAAAEKAPDAVKVQEAAKAPDYLGQYDLYAMADDEMCILAADFLEDTDSYLILKEDGKGEILFDEKADVEYTISGSKIALTADGETVEGTIEKGIITLDIEGAVLYFAAPDADTSGIEAVSIVDAFSAAFGGGEGESYEGTSAALGDYYVEIVGAEAFEDGEGKDSVRFYYDFTNNSEKLASGGFDITFKAEEDGYELVSTYAMINEEAYEDGNESLSIEPGVTIRCIAEFNFKPDGKDLICTLSEFYSGDSLTATFDPGNLSGAPTEKRELVLIDNPQFLYDLPYEGEFISGNFYSIDNAEIDEDWEGNEIIRFYYIFTNNSDETTTPSSDISVYAFQDGIALPYAFAANSIEEDDNLYKDVAPGESITVSECFEIRTDSPIEFYINDWTDWDNDISGISDVFTLTE